jgi:isopentenyl-diphosphate delta-isomerase
MHPSSPSAHNKIVSFDNEALIVVDPTDRILGHGTKAELHRGSGTLHRAFSIFLFNPAGELLLQRRSEKKPLWPGFWSNTCCSHPRRGESYGTATERRLAEELGIEAKLFFTHRFRYQAQYSEDGAEHELCSVYVGLTDHEPSPNPSEISAWQWIQPDELDRWLLEEPATLTPWLNLEWSALRSGRHANVLGKVGLRWRQRGPRAS